MGGAEGARGLRVAFLQRYCVESLGLMHLAAVLRQDGHEPRLFVAGLERDLEAAIVAWRPQVLGVSLYSGQVAWAVEQVRRLKERWPSMRVVAGGPHATFAPEVIELGAFDAVVRGEGEQPLRALCAALRAGEDWRAVAGTWSWDRGTVQTNPLAPPVAELDDLPDPDRALFYRYPALGRRRSKAFAGGRGCSGACSFCHNQGAARLFRGMGPWVRRRSPERLVVEIERVRDRFPPLEVVNLENDDDLLHDPAWYEPFFELYGRRVGLPFLAMVRADHVTPESARGLRRAGCVAVGLALETANDEIRRRVLLKPFTAARFAEAMASLQAEGLDTKVYNMVGIPGESFEDALATLDLNLALRPTWSMCSLLQPYPGTAIRERCLREGLLPEPTGADDGHPALFFEGSPLRLPEAERLVNLQRLFSLTVRKPRLRPAVEGLTRLPRNRLFDLGATLVYGLQGARSHRLSLRETLELARCSQGWREEG